MNAVESKLLIRENLFHAYKLFKFHSYCFWGLPQTPDLHRDILRRSRKSKTPFRAEVNF